MIRTCLVIPAFATEEAVSRTLECLQAAALPRVGISVYAYCEQEEIPQNIDLTGVRCFPAAFAELEAEMLKWSAEDVFVPLFAGDTFGPELLKVGMEAMNRANRVVVMGDTAACVHLIRCRVFNARAFVANLKLSCVTAADSIPSCVAKDAVVKRVDGVCQVRSLCWDVEAINFPENKRRVWAFCAGQYSNDFRGNPKYLFLYMNRHRTDVVTYWLCESEEVISLIRYMGMCALKLGTVAAELAIDRTGVLVSEQVKASIPAGLEDAVYLNLWHGVGGVKAVERSMLDGRLAIEIAKKYIQHNAYFRKNEMYLAPSKFIEDIASEQLGLESHQIIRSGYPRNIYQSKYERVATFDHGCFRAAGLPEDVRFAAYIPTYRNDQKGDLFASAIPDMDRLIQTCQKEHICLIFKMHPLLESEMSFQQAKEAYANNPWVYFWDNRNDFYEVLDQMDLCIFDYSSMFTDFIAAGCKNFLRYAFDFTGSDLDFPMDYDEATLGRKCTSFEELLAALGSYQNDDLKADIRRIGNLYWKHATPDSMERIVKAVLAFKPVEQDLPTLYSFDIFDTLISRRVLAPEGIFYRVQERIQQSDVRFPKYLEKRYPFIRHNAELNMREYYNRSKTERNDERCEIQLDEIMKRMQTLYELTDEQTALLRRWEIEAELEDVLPLEKPIARVKELLAAGETVILISDMYLPEDVIRQMLERADPVLAKLPLYLSSQRGYQKSARTLFMEVYKDYSPDYRFGSWIHTGDNLNSDIKNPRTLNIETIPAHRTEFNAYEAALAEALQSYDGYLIAASMARFREEHPSMQDQFAYSYISLLFVPYVHWAMNSSKAHGKKNVYLIARDGHQLKRIADVVNKAEGLGLNTKYVYASRRVWRIPSFFDHIDVGFWGQGYGNMAKVNKFSKLLKALDMDEPTFRTMFPELQALNEETEISPEEIVRLSGIFQNSEKYLHYLLDRAEKQRIATCEYLAQEMDTNEPFSIIEYWGRGYTQENFTRLWQHVCGRKEPTTFYYSRSTLPSDEDNIRMNFTSHPSSQAFIESIFACINYKTILSYRQVDGKWMPVTEPIVCNRDLFSAMEAYLPLFAENFCSLPMTDRATTGRNLIDFAISWYNEHPEWEGFTKVLAKLVDSVEMYGAKTAFANPITQETLDAINEGMTRGQLSKNIAISYHRAEKDIQQKFCEMFQIREGELLTSGWKITDASILRNRKAVQDLSLRRKHQARMQTVYDEAVRENPLEQKILLVCPGAEFGEIEYGSIIRALENQKEYTVEKLCLGKNPPKPEALMEIFASSRVIMSFAPLRQLSGIQLRPETRLVILGETPVQLFCTGLLRKEILRDVKDLGDYNLTNEISTIHVSSAVTAERARGIYSMGSRTEILQTGSVITDCYRDEELRDSLRHKLRMLCPEAEGKKIVAYLPLHRLRNASSKYAYLLDMKRMQKALGNRYFVAMHLMDGAKDMTNEAEIDGFSCNLAKDMTPRALMLAADVIVADYRDTTYEAPLAGVPTFVTCGDKRIINGRDSLFCPVEEMIFGVPVNDTDALIEQLQNLKSYDDGYRSRFVEKYLTACDGKAALRVVEDACRRENAGLILPDIGPYEAEKSDFRIAAPDVKVCMDMDDETVVLHWDPVPGAEAYEVLASETADGPFAKVCDAKLESCVHRIRKEEAVDLWYRIRVIGGDSMQSSSSRAVFARDVRKAIRGEITAQAPQIRWVMPSGRGNRLYWQGDVNCAGWRVRCRYGDGTRRQVDHLHVNTWEWTDRDASADAKAVYEICSLYWAAGGKLVEGPASEQQKVMKIAGTELVLDKFLRGKFSITWEPVEGAVAYRLYRRDSLRGEFAPVVSLEQPGYTETGMASGKVAYLLEVQTDSGLKLSRPLAVEIPTDLPKPTGLVVRRLESGNCLLWNGGVDADKWNIRLCTREDDAGKKIATIPGNQTWWVDAEHGEGAYYRVEAMRKVSGAKQFSGYCPAAKAE